jgi:hypothetical protein
LQLNHENLSRTVPNVPADMQTLQHSERFDPFEFEDVRENMPAYVQAALHPDHLPTPAPQPIGAGPVDKAKRIFCAPPEAVATMEAYAMGPPVDRSGSE